MDAIKAITDFFLSEGAGAGLAGAVIMLIGCNFANLDVGVRKNKPLRSETFVNKCSFIFGGLLMGAIMYKSAYPYEFPFFILVSIGACWIYGAQSLSICGKVFIAAWEKRQKQIAKAAGAGNV